MADIPNISNYKEFRAIEMPTYFKAELGVDDDEVLLLIRAKKDDLKAHLVRLSWALLTRVKKMI